MKKWVKVLLISFLVVGVIGYLTDNDKPSQQESVQTEKQETSEVSSTVQRSRTAESSSTVTSLQRSKTEESSAVQTQEVSEISLIELNEDTSISAEEDFSTELVRQTVTEEDSSVPETVKET